MSLSVSTQNWCLEGVTFLLGDLFYDQVYLFVGIVTWITVDHT